MATSDAAPTSEELSVFHAPRPFKAAAFVERASGSTKRNKTLKQILNMERDAQLQRLGVDKKRKEAKRRRTTEEAAAEPEAAATPASPIDDGAERRMVPTCTWKPLTQTPASRRRRVCCRPSGIATLRACRYVVRSHRRRTRTPRRGCGTTVRRSTTSSRDLCVCALTTGAWRGQCIPCAAWERVTADVVVVCLDEARAVRRAPRTQLVGDRPVRDGGRVAGLLATYFA